MLTFAHPMLLWGLLALLSPLLLHLLNRQQPRLLVFPSIRFLTRAQLPREGRRRLRDKLLLLLRMLILAAAVLLLAKPKWTPKAEPLLETQALKAVFVLDNSASMQGHGAAARAVAMIEEELATLADWEVGLVVADRDVVSTLPPGAGKASLRAALAAYSPSFLAGDPAAGLQQAMSWLEDGGQRRRLILVSDLQRGDWEGVTANLPTEVELTVLDAGLDGAANVGISSVKCLSLPGGGRRILVGVRNYSGTSQERTLTVIAAGNQLQQAVELTPLHQRRVVFVLPEEALPEGKASQAVAKLSQDDYPPDDEYHFWMGEVPAPKALLLLPPEMNPSAEEAAFFVSKALQAEDGGVPGFAVETIVTDLLGEVNLSHFQVVFLLSCAEDLPLASLEALAEHTLAGAVVFVTPGTAPNQALLALRQAGLFAAQGQGVAGSGRDVSLGIGWVAPDSILDGLYGKPQESDLFMFSIRRFLRLQIEPSVQPLLKSLDDWPVLAEKVVGSGRCYYSALNFSLDWSDFPLTTSFLPTIRELCLAAVSSGHGVHRLQCGEQLPAAIGLLPESSTIGNDTREQASWERPGLHQVGEWPIEVQVATRESMTDRVNADDLRHQLLPQRQDRQQSLPLNLAGADGHEWWKLCAWIMATLMLAEAALRWKSGEQR